MGIYRKISFLSIKAEISTLDDFLALFMNRRIIFSQKMEKKIFRRKHLATLSQRSPVKSKLYWFIRYKGIQKLSIFSDMLIYFKAIR